MQFPILLIIIFIQIEINLGNNFIVYDHSEYISIMDTNGKIKNYNLEIITPKNKLYLDLKSNLISYINNLFYYLTKDDVNWKKIITLSRNDFTIYFEDFTTFYSKIDEILNEKSVMNRIRQIIIGFNSDSDKNELNIDTYPNDINIFINRNSDEIKTKYSLFSNSVFCSTYINFNYSGDVYADNFVIFAFCFLIIFIIFWGIIHHKARKNNKYLFVHSYILTVSFFYFFHSLFFLIITMKKKYQYFDEEIYTGAFYNTFNFFQFFTKLLPALCATIQLNLIELREHYRIIRNSKVIHILSANIFFVISLENDNQNLSEILNEIFYVLIVICLFYMFIQIKNCLEEKIIDAVIDDPEIIPTLKYKKMLLYVHWFSILAFIVVYFFVISVFKYVFVEYRTLKLIIIMINYSDLFLFFLLCGIYFPRELPPQFIEQIILEPDININNEENDYFENIYAYDQTDEEKYFENYKVGEMANIVIIENPFNENKIEIEEIEEEEEEEEKEIKDDNKDNNKKNDHIETTEEDSNDNKETNNTINIDNEINDEKIENKNNNNDIKNCNDIDNIQNNEEENNILVCKENDKINKSCIEEDILDLYHTKLGYIEDV